jgi:hypothetical protein
MAKEIDNLIAEAKSLGYFVKRITSKGHIMFEHKDNGATVTTSGTPSDRRAYKNCIARLRRFAPPTE